MKLFQHLVILSISSAVLTISSCSKSAEHYLRQGRAMAEAGKLPEAEIAYKNAIQVNGRNGEAHLLLGKLYLKQGKKGDAYRSFTQAAETTPDATEVREDLLNTALDLYLADPRRPQSLFAQIQTGSEALLRQDASSFAGLRAKGYLLLTSRRIEDAVTVLEAARKQRPDDLLAVKGLIAAYGQSKRLNEAEAVALQAIERDRTLGPIYDELYAMYSETGRMAEAGKVFEQKVAKNPDVVAYRLQLAAHLFNQKDEAAMGAVLRSLENYDVGRFYMRLGKWEEAIVILRRAAAETPARRLAAGKSEMQALTALGRTAEALAVAERLAASDPEDREIRLARAAFWIDNNDSEKALAELEKIKDRLKEVPSYWLAVGRGYRQLGDTQNALAAYRELGKFVGQGVTAGLAQAEILLLKGQTAQAAPHVQAALEREPKNKRARLLRAQIQLKTGRGGEAKAELLALAKEQPDFVDGQLQLGALLQGEKRFAEAELIYLKLGPKGFAALARSQVARGQAAKAIQTLEQELPRSKNPREVQLLIAQVALEAKLPEVALKHLHRLVQAEPNAAIDHYLLGQAQRSKGSISEAAGEFARAAELNPKDAAAISMLGMTLRDMGRKDEALKQFRRALALSPRDSNMMNAVAYVQAECGGDLDEAQALVESALKAVPKHAAYLDTLQFIRSKKGRG